MTDLSDCTPNSPSLYIHIPFCFSRCGYCTFTSTLYDSGVADKYITALAEELSTRNIFLADSLPSSIFIGGGTPTCLSIRQMESLLALLPQPITCEATCEINPDSCSREKLELLKRYGINRISFGVQTFDGDGLRLLQRRHSRQNALDAVEMAVNMGFASVNVDLISGWPGQTFATMENDINLSISLNIHHISNYSLILEPSAQSHALYADLLRHEERDDEEERRYSDFIDDLLCSQGFEHYETSNFCRIGYQCRHNTAIWRGGEYLGIGLGACSHLHGERTGNITDIAQYIHCSSNPERLSAYRERLAPEAKARECALFWLRLYDGIDLAAFRHRTGFDLFSLYENILPGLLHEGIVLTDGVRLWVARHYQPVLDGVLEYLV